MKIQLTSAICAACVAFGAGVVLAAKDKGPGMELIRGKPAHEAGIASLQEAEKLAGSGSWELLGVARVYFLSGDKSKGQALIDRVLSSKPNSSDWFRIGQIYAEAGDNAKAEEYFTKALAADPKDDTGHAEVGAWYLRHGDREKGEAELAKAFEKHPDEVWHYVRAAEGLLNVPPGH